MLADFDGSRLSLARRMQRMPRTVLSSKVDLSAAAITQFERETSRPTNAAAAELALALGVPVEFFRRGRPVELIEPGGAHFRSLRSAPAISRDQALAFAEIALATVDLLEQYVDLPPMDLPDYPVDVALDPGDIEIVANETRRAMGLPAGPIPNVVRLLESRGVVVLRLPPTLDERLDAFSTGTPRRSLVLLSGQKADRARSRFDASHELGHLVMHHGIEPGSKIVENQAQTFAAEFLAPSSELLDHLPRRIDWAQLHSLKAQWGVSLRSLVFRAHASGRWGDATYRRAMQILAEQGFPEPGALGPPESPSMVGTAIRLIEDSGLPAASIAEAGKIPIDMLQMIVMAGTETRPVVRVETGRRL